MEHATINRTRLDYETTGAGEPVLFIYGAFVADLFRPVIDQPGLAGYRRIHYHRRGYAGSSSAAGPVTISAVAADAAALLEHLGVARAHVVGHSYGGAVALQLAIDALERVHTLALVEPALMAGASAPVYRESLAASAQRYRHDDPAAVVDAFLKARLPAAGLDPAGGGRRPARGHPVPAAPGSSRCRREAVRPLGASPAPG
jgi:pimeloyl-ACP methyl ester carboxylesterase